MPIWLTKLGPEVLNLEVEIYPANKSQITKTAKYFLQNIAEHESFSAKTYENAFVSSFILYFY